MKPIRKMWNFKNNLAISYSKLGEYAKCVGEFGRGLEFL